VGVVLFLILYSLFLNHKSFIMDYYETLGVSRSATPDEIKKAYRKLAQKYHPDRAGGDAQKFKQVNEAYQTLSDDQKRAQYNQYGASFEQMRNQGQAGGFRDFRDFATFSEEFGRGGGNTSFDFSDLFGDIFGQSFSGRRRQNRGADIDLEMAIDLEDAIRGAEREINVDKYSSCSTCNGSGVAPGSGFKTCPQCGGSGQFQNQQQSFLGLFSIKTICPNCQGQGKIPEKQCDDCRGQGRIKKKATIKFKIPAGIQTGQVINLSGQGQASGVGGHPGDLNIHIILRPHKFFQRSGDDLYFDVKARFTQLVLGDKIKVPTPQGDVWVNIPKSAQPGSQIRLRGKGVPHLQSHGAGDEIIRLILEVPRRLSGKQKKLLEELQQQGI